jgi:GDP-L-fucose synthase
MKKDSKILVLGGTGLVGSAVKRELQRKGYENLILPPRKHFDLRIQDVAYKVIGNSQPEYVFNCAAHSGGISEAIEKPAEMLCDNLYIQANVIEACRRVKVKKLLNFASSCIYPVNGEQPYKEEQIGDGKTDENWSYAVSKICGIEMCRAYNKQYGCNFMTVVPCNVYGINDNFGENGHVIPSLISKCHNNNKPQIWGNGLSKREFIYSDDLANACVMLMEEYNYDNLLDGVINIGVGKEITIWELGSLIGGVVNMNGDADWLLDMQKPSGVKSKLMDNTIILDFGWKPEISLEEGIGRVYEWYKERN